MKTFSLIDTNEIHYNKLKTFLEKDNISISLVQVRKSESVLDISKKLFDSGSEPHGIIINLEGEFENSLKSDFKGVALLMTLRVSKQYLKPIITLSFLSVGQLLRRNPQWLVLSAPGNHHIALPEDITFLRKFIGTLSPAANSEQELRKTYIPYLKPAFDESIIKHDFGNYAGILKFQQELKRSDSQLNFPFNKELENKRNTVLYSVIELLQTELEDPAGPKPQVKSLRSKIKDSKVLLIDDEARLGWADSLSLLFFRENATDSPNFEVIDNWQNAINRFPDNIDELTQVGLEAKNNIKLLKTTENNLNSLLNAKIIELDKVNKEIETLNDEIAAFTTRLENIETSWEVSQQDFKNSVQELFQETAKISIDERIESVKSLFYLFKQNEDIEFKKVKWGKELASKKENTVLLKIKSEEIEEEIKNISPQITGTVNKIKELELQSAATPRVSFDLILLDLNLSPANNYQGIDILKNIRKANQTVPIIVFSSSNNAINVIELYNQGCNAYFIKNRHTMAHLCQVVLDNTLFLQLPNGLNNGTLQERLNRIYISEKLYGKKAHQSGSFTTIELNEDKTTSIKQTLKHMFPVRQRMPDLKFLALELGRIQELYIDTSGLSGETGFLYGKDNSRLRKLRNAAAHTDQWNENKESEWQLDFYKSLAHILILLTSSNT